MAVLDLNKQACEVLHLKV